MNVTEKGIDLGWGKWGEIRRKIQIWVKLSSMIDLGVLSGLISADVVTFFLGLHIVLACEADDVHSHHGRTPVQPVRSAPTAPVPGSPGCRHGWHTMGEEVKWNLGGCLAHLRVTKHRWGLHCAL